MGVSTTSAQATLDALSDPVVVLDRGGCVQLVNAAAARLLAEEAEAILGRPLAALLPDRIHEVDGTPILERLQRAAEAGPRPVRVPFLRSDGVEIHQVVQVTTTRADGVGPVTILMLRSPADGPNDLEMDPLHLAAPAPSPESSYRVVFESVPVGVLHFDSIGRITACNEMFVEQMGSSRQLLLGLNLCTLPNAEVVACVQQSLRGETGLFEGEYVSATGGRRRLYRAMFSPIVRDGAIEGGVGVVEDITERRVIERRLAEGERMASLGRLAAGVAHEINNPLAYVRTSLDIARRRLEQYSETGDPAHLEAVDDGFRRAFDGVERVRVIASDLKTFSRGDDGSWMPVSVAKVVDTAVNLAMAQIKGVATLERDIEGAPYVMGSETRFVQVLVNLLVNAAQAIEQAGGDGHTITVRVRSRADRVRIDVEDTGVGIPRERVDHVFEPFWTSKPRGMGTGLGLSICHGIVTSAGGDIRVLRSAPDEGTTVRVELPASPHRASRPSSPEGPDPAAPTTSRPRVLVIDDEIRLAKTLALGLGDRFAMDIVGEGRAALERLRAPEGYDVVICDLMMPGMSGMDVFETIRAERPELAERFVFMTGGAFTERARDFLAQHELRRVEKPFALEDIERIVGEVAEG